MKAQILVLLRERADYVSGQELCEHFGVSRTAVWKAIEQLRKEGYRIDAVPNKGYRLAEETLSQDIFCENEIVSRLRTKWVGHPVRFYEKTGSTNIQAKMEGENGGQSGMLFVADQQTAGRGRRGRSWDSPAGTNVYFTLLLKPDFAPDKAAMLTIVMAMAVARGIEKAGVPNPGIKWPNDIVVNGKKVCGILTEMSTEREYIQHVVIGVGINVKKQDFAPEIADKATTLEVECGYPVSRSALVADIMEAFEEYYESFVQTEDLSGLQEAYDAMLVNKGREVCVLDPKGEYRGIARGINATGELLVEMPDGSIREVYAGEVSVRGIYGYV